jgi:hypothetical protein
VKLRPSAVIGGIFSLEVFMPKSVSVGQPVAHPSLVAVAMAANIPATVVPKTGTVLSTNLPVCISVATANGGSVTQYNATGGSLVSWKNQPVPTLMSTSDLT